MAATRVHINPNILTWAIRRVGKDVDEYAQKDTNFQKWLEGSKLPTMKNIEDFAKKFYVPLGYMFLDTPPQEECPIPFYRSTTNEHNNINVYDTVLTIQERQEWLSGYLRSEGFNKNLFVGLIKDYSNVDEACRTIYEILNLPINWAFDFTKVEDALKHITNILEDKGVMVCYNGVVGYNNNRPIPVKECRGFALIDDYAPFIFINNKDAKSAQMFTIIHELVHILIGHSAGFGDNDGQIQESILERFCDKVSATFLVPEILLKEEWSKVGENYVVLAKRFKVSRFVIARRAMDIGYISEQHYYSLYRQWRNEKTDTPTKQSGGGVFIPTAIKKTSRTFLIHINNAISRNRLLHMDAYRLTGLKGDSFHKIINSPQFARL